MKLPALRSSTLEWCRSPSNRRLPIVPRSMTARSGDGGRDSSLTARRELLGALLEHGRPKVLRLPDVQRPGVLPGDLGEVEDQVRAVVDDLKPAGPEKPLPILFTLRPEPVAQQAQRLGDRSLSVKAIRQASLVRCMQ